MGSGQHEEKDGPATPVQTVTEARGDCSIEVRIQRKSKEVYWTEWLGGSHHRVFYYVVYDIKVEKAGKRKREYRRVDPYHIYSPCFFVLEKVAAAGDGVVMEYSVVPVRFVADSHRGWDMFHGYSRIMRKYARDGSVVRARNGQDAGPYEWKYLHNWDGITATQFEASSANMPVVEVGSLSAGLMAPDFDQSWSYYSARMASETRESVFFEAVKEHRVAAALEMLSDDPGLVFATDFDGKTVLHVALESSTRWDLLPEVLKRNPPVNFVDYSGQTPLFAAARAGCPAEITKELVRRGALISFADPQFYGVRGQYDIPRECWRKLECVKEGWIGENAYGVWVPFKRSGSLGQNPVLEEGRRRIARDLRIEELTDPPPTMLKRKLAWMLGSAREMCESDGRTAGERKVFVCVFAGDLKRLVAEYGKSAGR